MNLPSILVGAALILILALVVRKMIRDKKNGKSSCSCGGNCSGCGGQCHH